MSKIFNAFESSDFLGRQVRLYKFSRGSREWRYNSSEIDVAYGGQVYVSLPIEDSGIQQKGEVATDDFTITVPVDNPVAMSFNGVAPSDLIKVTMRLVQYQDPDQDAPLVFTGYVSKCKLRDEMECDLICNSQVAYLSRRGLRLGYTRQCPFALYDESCKVNPAFWGEGGKVEALGPKNITFSLTNDIPNAVDGRFTGGYIEFILGVSPETTTERRAIESHTGNGLLLLGLTTGLVLAQGIVIYPGCTQVPTSCARFNNLPNYGGFTMMPGKSPFDGDPVF